MPSPDETSDSVLDVQQTPPKRKRGKSARFRRKNVHKQEHALDPRGGETRGEGEAGERAWGASTSTNGQSTINSSYDKHYDPNLLQEYATKLAQPPKPQSRTHASPEDFATVELTRSTFPHNAGSVTRQPAPTTPGQCLMTEEQQAAFAEAVADSGGIKPACKAWGLKSSAVFYHSQRFPDFRKHLNAGMSAHWEDQVHKLDDLCTKLLKMDPREMNQCANAYGRVFDYRMRIVGKLMPVVYGDRPGTQINVQSNVGIVCDESTRERLIELNRKLLQSPAKAQVTND